MNFPFICINIPAAHAQSRPCPSSFITCHRIWTRTTRQVPLVDQELLTLPEHLCSPPVFSRVRVSRSLVLGVCFIYHCLSFCTFSLAVCCLFFFDLWIMITPLVSSNSPYIFKVNTISNASICPGWQTKYDIINLICQLIN